MQPEGTTHVARDIGTGEVVADGRTFRELCEAMDRAKIARGTVIAEVVRETRNG